MMGGKATRAGGGHAQPAGAAASESDAQALTLGLRGRSASHAPFAVGELVIATLSAPREKFWGAVLSLSAAGVKLTGVDLNSFDEALRSVREGEPIGISTVFFPMHRVERIEVDASAAGLPSLGERCERATGRSAAEFLGTAAPLVLSAGTTLHEATARLAIATLASCEGDARRAAAMLGISADELSELVRT